MQAEDLLERCGPGPEWDRAYYDAMAIISGDDADAKQSTKTRIRERRFAEVRATELLQQHQQQSARAMSRQLRRTRR